MGNADSKAPVPPAKARPRTRQIVIAGPSGAGKGTLIARLNESFPSSFGFSVSHTTRDPRPGEVDGKDYHFSKREDMQRSIDAGNFLEYADVHGRFYGTSYKSVLSVGKQDNRICILDIDMQGVRSVKKSHVLNPFFVYVAPPSLPVLEQRLRGRGTESDEAVRKRMANAQGEIEFAETSGAFNAKVVNDDLELAFVELVALLRKEFADLPEPLPPSPRRTTRHADETPSKFRARAAADKVSAVVDPLSPSTLTLGTLDVLQDLVQIDKAAGDAVLDEGDATAGDGNGDGTGTAGSAGAPRGKDGYWVMCELTGQYHKVDSEAALQDEVAKAAQAVPGELAATSHSRPGWPIRRAGLLPPAPGAPSNSVAQAGVPVTMTSIVHDSDWAFSQRAQTHVRWSWRASDEGGQDADEVSRKYNSVELVHAHRGGGFREVVVNGKVIHTGRSMSTALYDSGSRTDFEHGGRHFTAAVCLQGTLLSQFQQYYTYHLYVDGKPAAQLGLPAATDDGEEGAPQTSDIVNTLLFGGDIDAPRPKPQTPTTLQRRKIEFIQFYKERDPSMIPKVDALLTGHRFADIVASLKKKYGEAPPGWDVDVPAASSGAEAQGATAAKPAPSEAVETL